MQTHFECNKKKLQEENIAKCKIRKVQTEVKKVENRAKVCVEIEWNIQSGITFGEIRCKIVIRVRTNLKMAKNILFHLILCVYCTLLVFGVLFKSFKMNEIVLFRFWGWFQSSLRYSLRYLLSNRTIDFKKEYTILEAWLFSVILKVL